MMQGMKMISAHHRLAWVIGLLLMLLASAVLADASPAAWSGRNGAIAFSRSSSPFSPSDIWVQTRSGEQRRLTATPGVDETSPTFSRDGRWIAYVRRAGEDSDIWLMRSDGSDKRVVVDSEIDEFQPSFYPGGRSLVFATYDGERSWTVFSVLKNGDGLTRQAANATYPVISPDGRWLAYSQDGAGGGIRLRSVNGGRVRTLTTGSAQELDFSPNGRRLVFTGQRRCRSGERQLHFALLSVGLSGGHPRFLRRSCKQEFISPAWSPDGGKIVFTRKAFEGSRKLHFELAMMTAGGTPIGGAPTHRRDSEETFPSWQPLR